MSEAIADVLDRLGHEKLNIVLTTNFTSAPFEFVLKDIQKTAGTKFSTKTISFKDSHDRNEENAEGLDDLHIVMVDFDSIVENSYLMTNQNERGSLLELSIDLFCQELRLFLTSIRKAKLTLIVPLSVKPRNRTDETILHRYYFSHFESLIRELISDESSTDILDVQTSLNEVGTAQCYSPRSDFQAQSPFTIFGARLIIEAALRSYSVYESKPYKVLLLDADNTLWGGVLGDVGSDKLSLHPTTFPGNIFWRIQHVLKSFKEQGLLLVLITKNERDAVIHHLANHESQILREEDFVLISADWTPKPDRVKAIAEDLSLSLDSMIFLDDSSTEIMAMNSQLPEILTVQVPQNASEYLSRLRELSELLARQSSENDRTEQYRVRSRSKELMRTAGSHTDFLSMLQTKLSLRCNQLGDIHRISELSERTNQFNLSLKKFSVDELRQKIEHAAHKVWLGSVSDVLGDSGTSIAMITRTDGPDVTVEGFWVSCRVLGRELEHAMVCSVAKIEMEQGAKSLHFLFNFGLKNKQVSDFLKALPTKLVTERDQDSIEFDYDVETIAIRNPVHVEVIYE